MLPTSKIHKDLSELLNTPKVLTHPQEFLGLNYKKVLEFWSKLDTLTEEHLKIIDRRYWNFHNHRYSEWDKKTIRTIKASRETIGRKFAYHAAWASLVVYNWASYYATRELIGNVKKPVFLKMFDNLIENSSQ